MTNLQYLREDERAEWQDAEDCDSCSPECHYRSWISILLRRLNEARAEAAKLDPCELTAVDAAHEAGYQQGRNGEERENEK